MASYRYNYTDRTRKVLALARDEAVRLRHDYIGTEHILLGLLREGEGVAVAALMSLEIDLKQIHDHLNDAMREGNVQRVQPDTLTYTTSAKSVLENAAAEAASLRHAYIGTEHVLLGLLREQNGSAAQVLESSGVTFERVRSEILRLLGFVA